MSKMCTLYCNKLNCWNTNSVAKMQEIKLKHIK